MAEVQFLFDNQLISELETLIKESKKRLFLVSPFIDLDRRIQDALRERQSRHDFEILVLFGKNEENLYKSIKRDSLEFLKQFPNIEIRYNDRLHAKYYQNDFNFIMTSLNLYDYSLAKNIEVGIICNYAAKGLLGTVINTADTLIAKGDEKLRHDVLGLKKDVNPIEKFEAIFNHSELKYKTEPIISEKGGISGVLGGKKLDGFNVVIDNLVNVSNSTPEKNTIQDIGTNNNIKFDTSGKTLSASQFSKMLGVSQADFIKLMQQKGLINNDNITEAGVKKGLLMKNYMGKDYISYPDNLPEINELKK